MNAQSEISKKEKALCLDYLKDDIIERLDSFEKSLEGNYIDKKGALLVTTEEFYSIFSQIVSSRRDKLLISEMKEQVDTGNNQPLERFMESFIRSKIKTLEVFCRNNFYYETEDEIFGEEVFWSSLYVIAKEKMNLTI